MAVLVLALSWAQVSIAADTSAQAQRYYERALAMYGERDYVAAVIELKNAIRLNADGLAPRVLLAKIYLAQGHASEAEHEIQNVTKRGADPSLTVPVLAKAYLFQFKERQLLDELSDDGLSNSARADLLQVRGQALMNIGDNEAAMAAFDAVEKLLPASAQALIGKTLAALRSNDIDKAAQFAERAVKLEPANADAWNAQAAVFHSRGELAKALVLYDKAIALSPALHDARIARIAIQLVQGKNAETAADLAYEAQHNPFDPRPAYLRALRFARADDVHGANSALAEANILLENINSEATSNNCQLLDLAGSVNYGLGRFEQARDYYQLCLNGNPKLTDIRKKLAGALLALHDAARVLELFAEERTLESDDPEILAILANALMTKGEVDKATRLLQKAASLPGAGNAPRKTLAFHQIYSGRTDQAQGELAAVLAADPDDVQANLLMAVLHHQRGEFAASVALLEQLLKKAPDNVVLLNFIAVAQSALGHSKAARGNLEKALKQLPAFVPGIINLARLDVAKGAVAAAKMRLGEALKLYPGSPELLLELAHLLADSGEREQAITVLDYGRKFAGPSDAQVTPPASTGAVAMNAQAPSASTTEVKHAGQPSAAALSLDVRFYLAELLLSGNKRLEAKAVMAELAAQAPDDLRTHELRVRTALQSGKRESLRGTLKKMSDMAGFDLPWLVRISVLQRQIGVLDDAQYSLNKAQQAHPDSLPVLVALTSLAIEQGKLGRAEASLKRLLAKWPTEIMSYRLAGDLALHRGDGLTAAAQYQNILDRAPSLEALELVVRAWGVAGRGLQGVKVLDNWIAAHPDDITARKLLADVYLVEKNPVAALKIYERLVREFPQDTSCLNNLAYLAELAGQPAALDYAKRAYDLSPRDANVNDTLGWILVRRNRGEEALRYLREADTLQADSSVIKFHLAQALIAVKQEVEARVALQDALRTGDAFDGIDEAKALLASLDKR